MTRTPIARTLAAAAATVLVLAGATACGSQDSSGSSGSSSPKTSSQTASPSDTPSAGTSASASPDAAGATIGIKDFAYRASGTVQAGAKITVTNDDTEAHTVTADGKGGFDVNVPPGKTATFTAPSKPGRYAYHCTFHSNMHGTLTVG